MRHFDDINTLFKSMTYILSPRLTQRPKIISKKSQKLRCYFGNYVVIFSSTMRPEVGRFFAMEALA